MQSNSICLFSTPTCDTEKSAHNPKTSIWIEFEIFLLHFCADPSGNKYKNVPFNQMSSFNATELFSHRLAFSKFSYIFFSIGLLHQRDRTHDYWPKTKWVYEKWKSSKEKFQNQIIPTERIHSVCGDDWDWVSGIFNTLLKRRKRANYIKYAQVNSKWSKVQCLAYKYRFDHLLSAFEVQTNTVAFSWE